MIEYRRDGSIFDCGAQGLVNPVNCVGTMGAGLAAEFKRRYGSMFAAYKRECQRSQIRVGKVSRWTIPGAEPPEYIFNFPTKDHWKNPSRIEWIRDGLTDLYSEATITQIQSLALPAIGCGYGGLAFEDVRPYIDEILSPLNIHVIVFEPQCRSF